MAKVWIFSFCEKFLGKFVQKNNSEVLEEKGMEWS